jgi:thioester reductase-like protein
LPYPELKAANVGGTHQALALAAEGRPSVFHHISTIEVFGGPADAPVAEDHPTGPASALRGGYAQSKWVAERLVAQAAERGLPAAIYRLPRIFGDTRTGACQTRDLLWQILKGCVQARAFPADLGAATVQIAPVDWTARTVVALARTAALPGAAYHVAGPARTSLGTLASYLRAAGYQLSEQPVSQWAATIYAQPGNAAIPALDIFIAEMTRPGWSQLHLGTAALAGKAVPCPDPTAALFSVYLDYFVQTGYLPPPGHVGTVPGNGHVLPDEAGVMSLPPGTR